MDNNKNNKTRALFRLLPIIAAGAGAGFINGLLGSGGGIVLIFAYSFIVKKKRSSKDNFATSLAVMTPVSAVSAIMYYLKAGADFSGAGKFCIAVVIGGIIGAYLADRIKSSTLTAVFAAVTCIAGLNMLFK